MKKDVDQFVPGKTSWIPYSHFKAKFCGDLTTISDLECVINVIGAREPHNKFTIDIIPNNSMPLPYDQLNLTPVSYTHLTLPTIYSV